MLINSDFERHGFELVATSSTQEDMYVLRERLVMGDIEIGVGIIAERKRNGIKKVRLLFTGEDVAHEMMWHPTQLREFLLFHKVIADNKK